MTYPTFWASGAYSRIPFRRRRRALFSLSAATWVQIDGEAAQMQALSKEAGVPWRMTEYGSANAGGQAGISDVFAAALWTMDHGFLFALRGASGVHFPNWFTYPYAAIPIDNGKVLDVRPTYYGLLMLRAAAQGRVVPVTAQTAGLNLTAYATLGDDATLRVVLINKDLSRDTTVPVTAGGGYSVATAMRLAAPAIDSTAGVTLGGALVGPDGGWAPSQVEIVTASGGVYSALIRAGSAMLLSFGNGSATVLNAASGKAGLAPLSLATAYGQGLAFVQRAAPSPDPCLSAARRSP
jgi:hypothetical protein